MNVLRVNHGIRDRVAGDQEGVVVSRGRFGAAVTAHVADGPQIVSPAVIDRRTDELDAAIEGQHRLPAAAVGSRPGGASWVGTLDMSGNVWKWVQGKQNLRGGSFNDESWYARCAVRDWPIPDRRNLFIGFRIVVSPVLPS